MASIIQDIGAELADNWPAFCYLAVMTGFSVRFLYERRAETRALREAADEMNATMRSRFDRLEQLVRSSTSAGGAADRILELKKFDGDPARLESSRSTTRH